MLPSGPAEMPPGWLAVGTAYSLTVMAGPAMLPAMLPAPDVPPLDPALPPEPLGIDPPEPARAPPLPIPPVPVEPPLEPLAPGIPPAPEPTSGTQLQESPCHRQSAPLPPPAAGDPSGPPRAP